MRKILSIAVLFVNLILSSNSIARNALVGDDLKFIGAFQVPLSAGAWESTAYGTGLALRRVNGEVRLFSTAYTGGDPRTYPLYELTVPTLRQVAPWNTAPLVKAWGDVLTNREGMINGLYWDETDKRLYYSSSWNYVSAGDPFYPTLAFITFSEDGTQTTSHGQWGFANRSFKQVNFGVTQVPTDFAAEFLGGKRLAAGFGGSQSAIGFGPGSFGPTLTAFSPPVIGTEGSYIPNTPLVGYGGSEGEWSSGDRPAISRAWRDDDVILDVYGSPCSDLDSSTQNFAPYWHLTGDETFCWQGYSVTGASRVGYPNNITFSDSAIKTKHWIPGNAFWTADYLGQSGVWIQTQNKEGFLLLPTFSTGHVWYFSSEPKAEGFKHQWYIYSRDQLARVATGTVAEHDIQASRYDADFSFSGVASRLFSGLPPYRCTGMAFDSVDNKLYVAMSMASNAPADNYNSTTLIYVYEVLDTPNAPNIGKRYRYISISDD